MVGVVWLIRARRSMQEALFPLEGGKSRERVLGHAYGLIGSALERAFPQAEAIVVHDRMSGYHRVADLHVLSLEVFGSGAGVPGADRDAEPYGLVAKVGAWKKLAPELAAWRRCGFAGKKADTVLMSLRLGCKGLGARRYGCLLYEDASRTPGDGEVVDLESALLRSTHFGTPPADSVCHAILALYAQLGAHFYRQHEVVAGSKMLRGWFGTKLRKWLDEWRDGAAPDSGEAERFRTRRETFGVLSGRSATFLDPCDYLASVLHCPEFAPRLLRGVAHGDLHGRNVLVNILHNETLSPAVFDYEDLGRDRLIGWDFVKLETELKVRALAELFKGKQTEYVRAVHDFELLLAEHTEARYDNRQPARPPDAAKLERLLSILLEIRARAQHQLGVQAARDREWLEEYYFLLGCYGVQSSRFESYGRREMIAAYVSAGVAVRRLSRPWARLREEIHAAERAAALLLADSDDPPEAIAQLEAAPCEMSHHARFAFASQWSRSARPDFVRAATRILNSLQSTYPHVLDVDQELALAHLELGEDAAAEKLLDGVMLRYHSQHFETHARWGRLWKDRAEHRVASSGDPDDPGAIQCYKRALVSYRNGFDEAREYYPGINVATLHFVLGEERAARAQVGTVRSLLDAAGARLEDPHDRSPGPSRDTIWITATRAECHLLLGESEQAAKCYRAAARSLASRDRATMRKQVELILAHAAPGLREAWPARKLDEIFAAERGAS